ncbi:MAG TPA: methyltransferase domain-containing protein [Verrucomicrobiae bacterium]|jgi:2-polyprenyl-3-methyl-5-hydroxy-6-metoxy-1,4-benzoquinol methylase
MPKPSLSFRDPAGSCCVLDKSVLRFVDRGNIEEFEGFLNTRVARTCVERKDLVSTRRLNEPEIEALFASSTLKPILEGRPNSIVFEHERVRFQSFPYEWPTEMLWGAGRLTLDIAISARADGYGLKDATPYNILFRGSKPIFIDALSFERRNPGDPIWLPMAQFIRTFLLPLLANRKWGVRLADVFVTHRDGLEPEELHRLCGSVEQFKPSLLSLVTMPTWLSRKAEENEDKIYKPQILENSEKAQFILESAFNRLSRNLESLRPAAQDKSNWSEYMKTHSYDDPAFSAKEKFVSDALKRFAPARVLDAGANTGHFSRLAARLGAEVVSIDIDPTCVGQIFAKASEEKMNILPLVVDLARPSPSVGWLNDECPSFLDRARGAFDGVLMLALLHHLLVTERVRLEQAMELAASLTTSILVIEFVAPEDAMFRRLTRGRDNLHSTLDTKSFEAACDAHFEIIESLALPGTKRTMYCLKKKSLN